MSEIEFSEEQLRRAVVQQLESLRRAGVTHWKQIAPAPIAQVAAPSKPAPTMATPPSVSKPAAPVAAAEPTPRQTVPPSSNNLFGETETEVAKKKSAASQPTPTAPRTEFVPLNLSLSERVAGLDALRQCVAKCTRCPELASTRTQTVFGVGNPQAKIMFIGEAPGADEDKQGEPFVGRAGQLLNDIIKACRMKREDIYICNVLRCRPPSNRLPAPEEAANCREYLDGQIAHVNPQYIVCWGACAAQNLLSMTDAIGKLRGRFFAYGQSKVVCTYHPSYLLRNPAAKKDVWEDMKLLFKDMGVDLSAKA